MLSGVYIGSPRLSAKSRIGFGDDFSRPLAGGIGRVISAATSCREFSSAANIGTANGPVPKTAIRIVLLFSFQFGNRRLQFPQAFFSNLRAAAFDLLQLL